MNSHLIRVCLAHERMRIALMLADQAQTERGHRHMTAIARSAYATVFVFFRNRNDPRSAIRRAISDLMQTEGVKTIRIDLLGSGVMLDCATEIDATKAGELLSQAGCTNVSTAKDPESTTWFVVSDYPEKR